MDQVTLSPAELAEIGVENQAELVAKLKLASQKGKSIETMENVSTALEKVAVEVSQAVSTLLEEKKQALEEDRFNEMAKSRLVEIYQSTPDDDPQKLQIRSEFEKLLGKSDTDTLLSNDEMVKMLQKPISKTNSEYEVTREMRKAFDYAILYAAGLGGVTKSQIDEDRVVVNPGTIKHCISKLADQGLPGAIELKKSVDTALDSVTATEGLEWIPAQLLSRNLYQDVWLRFRVAGNFDRFQSDGPNFSVPIRTGRARMYRMSEGTAVADYFQNKAKASSFNTGKIDFTMQKGGTLLFTSDELKMNSVIPVLDMIYEDLVFGTADGTEDAMINGSKLTNDLDNAVTDTNRLWANTADQGDGRRINTGAVDARNFWNGIRKNCLSGAKLASSSFSRNEILDIRALMGKYGIDPADLFLTVSPKTYIKMLKFTEVATLEKYGAAATVLQGELARIDNIPIMVSPHCYEDLNATGVFDNVTKTKTVAILTHKKAYAFADRMQFKVETERNMLSGQTAVLGTVMLDAQKMFKNTEPTEAILYNI